MNNKTDYITDKDFDFTKKQSNIHNYSNLSLYLKSCFEEGFVLTSLSILSGIFFLIALILMIFSY